jgi:hypothetical protein
MNESTAQPFAEGALIYRRKGWIGLFPLGRKDGPQYAKEPVPVGVTGYEGVDADYAKIEATCHAPAGRRNIGIRMPRHVVGLDVDDYDDKQGAATLRRAVEHLGDLPETFRSTARGPGDSGQLFFQLPVGWIAKPAAEEELARRFAPDGRTSHIEILMWARRYACVWPSLHPGLNLAQYRWYGPDGAFCDEPPATFHLGRLTGGWAELLGAPANSPAAMRRGGPKLRGITLTTETGEEWDEPQPAIRLSVAERITGEQVDAVLHMKAGRVRTTLGGAAVWLAKMAAAGLLTVEQVEEILLAAVKRNGVNSDRWNLANGRKWIARSKIEEGMSKGLSYVPYLIIEDLSPTDIHGQLMRRIGR